MEPHKIKTSDFELEVLHGVIKKAVNSQPTQSLPSAFQACGTFLLEIQNEVQESINGSAGGQDVKASAQSSEEGLIEDYLPPIRRPFGPPASGFRGFTRFRPYTNTDLIFAGSMHLTSSTLAKVQFTPFPSFPLFQTSVTLSLCQSRNAVNTSRTSNSTTLSSHHFKSSSESVVSTYVKGAKEIFEDMFAKKKKIREEQFGPSVAPFRPNRMALERDGFINSKKAFQVAGHPYKGSTNSGSFLAQISGLADEENCALWLPNVPKEATMSDMFGIIKTDDVLCLHLNAPDEDHPDQAAKLVFMTPEGARDFKALAEKGDFRFGGQKIEARYNRIGYKRYEKPETRVLYIEGPYWFMTEERWIEFFTKACVFELEYIGVIWETDRRKKMEFRFCRVDGQAVTCLLAITRAKNLPETIEVTFGLDPCNPESRKKIEQGLHKKIGYKKSQVRKAQLAKQQFNPLAANWRHKSFQEGK